MRTDISKFLQDEGAEVIELCSGRVKDGRTFHAFVQMDIESYQRYKNALSRNIPVDLNAFGKILHTGWGSAPDVAMARRVRETCTDNSKILEAISRDSRAMADILKNNSGESAA
ncbi:MAG TPA: hypothetical protein VL625_04805 [Patescibacteria group bacterium]|jgi:hypothetical protein|nr:hypothetical protein [Patescibacteria group bacterium]